MENKTDYWGIFKFLYIPLTLQYPEFAIWYWFKAVKNADSGKYMFMTVYTEHNHKPKLVAVAILKRGGKISTFYVRRSYRRKGYGTLLFKMCCNIFNKSVKEIHTTSYSGSMHKFLLAKGFVQLSEYYFHIH